MHIRAYRRTQDATRLSVQVFRGTEETPCSTRPGGFFRKDVSCPRGCGSACTCRHGNVLTKVRNCSSLTESSRRNYTSSLSLSLSLALSILFSVSLCAAVRISVPFSLVLADRISKPPRPGRIPLTSCSRISPNSTCSMCAINISACTLIYCAVRNFR